MVDTTPHRSVIALALAQLVASPEYPQLKDELIALVDIPHGGFVGTYSTLNALVEFGRRHGESALNPVWDVVERKRTQANEPKPAQAPKKSAPQSIRDRKTAYQAAYMAQRRARLRKATELYTKLHGETMSTQERIDFHNSLHTTWMLWRNELLEGVPPGAQRNEITQMFWADIDDMLKLGLDGDLETARKVLAED